MSAHFHRSQVGAALGGALWLALISGFPASRAAAFEQPKDWDPAVQQEIQQNEIMDSLAGVARAFGPHAVVLQAALLNEAVRNGSILEAKVDAPRFEDRDGKHYASFTLESGIVYNDNANSAVDRVRRTWSEIVATALHRLTELEIDHAQGVAVSVGYHHRPYDDERQLREQLPDGRGQAEKTSYYMQLDDAVGLAKGTANPDEVLLRSTVLRDTEVVDLK